MYNAISKTLWDVKHREYTHQFFKRFYDPPKALVVLMTGLASEMDTLNPMLTPIFL